MSLALAKLYDWYNINRTSCLRRVIIFHVFLAFNSPLSLDQRNGIAPARLIKLVVLAKARNKGKSPAAFLVIARHTRRSDGLFLEFLTTFLSAERGETICA